MSVDHVWGDTGKWKKLRHCCLINFTRRIFCQSLILLVFNKRDEVYTLKEINKAEYNPTCRWKSSEEQNSNNLFICPNKTVEQEALKAYNSYLQTTVLGEGDNCLPPCQFSILRTRTYFESNMVDSRREKVVVLRMPVIIKLTESTFSYPFMSFAAEFGG